jgi:hypothetical protein
MGKVAETGADPPSCFWDPIGVFGLLTTPTIDACLGLDRPLPVFPW